MEVLRCDYGAPGPARAIARSESALAPARRSGLFRPRACQLYAHAGPMHASAQPTRAPVLASVALAHQCGQRDARRLPPERA
eukprot:2578711-Alexandrium_andersonii.AAC.1